MFQFQMTSALIGGWQGTLKFKRSGHKRANGSVGAEFFGARNLLQRYHWTTLQFKLGTKNQWKLLHILAYFSSDIQLSKWNTFMHLNLSSFPTDVRPHWPVDWCDLYWQTLIQRKHFTLPCANHVTLKYALINIQPQEGVTLFPD